MPHLEVGALSSTLIRKQNEAHRSPVNYSKVTRLVISVVRFSHKLFESFSIFNYFRYLLLWRLARNRVERQREKQLYPFRANPEDSGVSLERFAKRV